MGTYLAFKHRQHIKDFVKYYIFAFPKPDTLASPVQLGDKPGEAAAAPVTQLTAVAV